MSPPALVVFSSEFPPHLLGGLGTHVQHMLEALRQSFAIQVIVPQRGGYSALDLIRLEEIPVAAEPDSIEFWLNYALGAARHASLSVHGPAVLQCHDWSTALAGVAARRLLGQPLVFNVHLPQRNERALAMENIGLLAADLVIVNSQAVRDEIARRNLPVRRIEIVPNGVDLEVFRPASTWPAHGGYVLFAGRLVPQKGVDVLVRAFAVLLHRLDCTLIVAGDGPLELYLQRLARYSGIPDRISFRHWQRGSDLIELFRNAAAVAVPSLYEPFGIVALEAMACARVPVVSNTGGLAEIVEHGADGYLVEPGDYLDLARRLCSLLTVPAQTLRMGEAARRKAGCYSWRRAALSTANLYGEVHYSGEDWLALPEARSIFHLLHQTLDDAHRAMLVEIIGTGVSA
jgi:1,4-alpha-glucan branching enzyme